MTCINAYQPCVKHLSKLISFHGLAFSPPPPVELVVEPGKTPAFSTACKTINHLLYYYLVNLQKRWSCKGPRTIFFKGLEKCPIPLLEDQNPSLSPMSCTQRRRDFTSQTDCKAALVKDERAFTLSSREKPSEFPGIQGQTEWWILPPHMSHTRTVLPRIF